MYNTTVVMAKETTSRRPTSGGMAKFEYVHLGNIVAIAQARTAVFVSSNPLVFHGVVGKGCGT